MSPVVALTTAGETRWMGGVSHGAVARCRVGKTEASVRSATAVCPAGWCADGARDTPSRRARAATHP